MSKTVVARITVVDDDNIASDEAAEKLMHELREVDGVAVRKATRPGAPDGARSDQIIAIGTLIVTLVAQLEAIATIVGFVREWRQRQHPTEIRIEINGRTLVITGADDAQIQAAIKRFLEEGIDPDA